MLLLIVVLVTFAIMLPDILGITNQLKLICNSQIIQYKMRADSLEEIATGPFALVAEELKRCPKPHSVTVVYDKETDKTVCHILWQVGKHDMRRADIDKDYKITFWTYKDGRKSELTWAERTRIPELLRAPVTTSTSTN